MTLKYGDTVKVKGENGRVVSVNDYGFYYVSDTHKEATFAEFKDLDIETTCNPSKIVCDDIKHPSRYNCGGYECQRVIEAVTADLKGLEAVNTGHIIRYAWRWKKKQPIKSLKKIKEYCDDLIEYLEKRGYNENDE